jgi:hypothetical protein
MVRLEVHYRPDQQVRDSALDSGQTENLVSFLHVLEVTYHVVIKVGVHVPLSSSE